MILAYSNMTMRWITSIGAFLLAGKLFAQANPAAAAFLDEFVTFEDPVALFMAEMEDADVSLNLDGSWKTGLSLGTSFPIDGSADSGAALDGFAIVPWSNTAELVMSLWYQKHFFFDLQFLDTFSSNTFLLGYEAAEAEGMKEFHLGNRDIGFADRQLLTFSPSSADVPGLHTVFSSGPFQGSFLARLVANATHTQTFIGTTPLESLEISGASWIRRRFFRLPWTDLATVRVYVEAPQGLAASDGHTYAALDAADLLLFYPEEGLVGLKEAPAGRVLIAATPSSESRSQLFPDLSAASVLSPADGIVFSPAAGSTFETAVLQPLQQSYGWPLANGTWSDLEIQIDGQTAILVSLPDLFSVFEDCSWYAVPSDSTINSLAIEGSSRDVVANQAAGAFQLSFSAVDPLSLEARYPLADLADSGFYVPGTPRPDKAAPAIIASIGQSSTSEKIILDEAAIPSSILVYRNSLPVTDFSYDESDHSVSLTPEPGPNEVIRIVYASQDPDADPNSLQLGFQGLVALDQSSSLGFGAGLEWPVSEDQLQTGTGSLGLGLDFTHKTDTLQFQTTLKGSWTVPNPAGVVLLQDYSDSLLTLLDSGSEFLPSPRPAVDLTMDSLALSGVLAESNRAFPLLRETELVNAALPGWQTVGDLVSGTAGQPSGPYLRLTERTDAFDATVAVLEFSEQAGRVWAAVDISLDDAEMAALQSTQTIRFRSAALDTGRSTHLLVRIGSTSEDLDADGLLDACSDTAGGMVLEHPDWPAAILIPTDSTETNARGEDRNANGLLDLGSAASQRIKHVRELTPYTGTSPDWQLTEWYLDAAELRAIASSRTISFILVGAAGSDLAPLAGRVGIAGIQCNLPTLQVQPESGNWIQTGTQNSTSHASLLLTAFPDLNATDSLSGSISYALPAGLAGRAVQVIGGRNLADGTTIQVHLFLTTGSTPASALTLGLADYQTTIASTTIDTSLPTGEWVRLELDTAAGTATIYNSANETLGHAPLSLAPGASRWDRLVIGLENSGVTPINGMLLVDEIRSIRALSRLGADARLRFSAALPGDLLVAGGIPLVSDLNFAMEAGGTANLYSASAAFLEDQSSLDFDLSTKASVRALGSTWSAGFSLDQILATPHWQLNYQAIIPDLKDVPFSIVHGYAEDHDTVLTYRNQAGLHVGTSDSFLLEMEGVAARTAQTIESIQYGLTGSLAAGQEFKAALAARLLQTETRASLSGEASAWTDSWNSLFFPSLDSVRTRELSLVPVTTLKLPGFSGMLDASLGLKRLASGRINNTAVLNSSFTLGDQDSLLNAALGYRRSLAYTAYPGDSLIGQDLWRLVEPLCWTAGFSLPLPFYELLDPALPETLLAEMAGFSQETLTQDVTLALDRQQDTAWTALVLPAELDLHLQRQLSVVVPDHEDLLGLAWQVEWTALNLLGASGTSPVFSGYETDSWSLKAGMAHEWNSFEYRASMLYEAFSLDLWGLDFGDDLNRSWRQQRSMIQGLVELQDAASLKLAQRLYCRDDLSLVSQSYSLALAWDARLPEWRPEFLGNKSLGPAYLHNAEVLTVLSTLSTDDESGDFLLRLAEAGSFTTMPLFVKMLHTTTLLIPAYAYISVSIGLGFGDYAGSEASRMGILAAIEAKLRL